MNKSCPPFGLTILAFDQMGMSYLFVGWSQCLFASLEIRGERNSLAFHHTRDQIEFVLLALCKVYHDLQMR